MREPSQGLNPPEDCEKLMQMYATCCTGDIRGYSWCVLNYSLRSPVTRRSLCTHVNPPPHHYLRLFCLCHVSGVQKFPRTERVSRLLFCVLNIKGVLRWLNKCFIFMSCRDERETIKIPKDMDDAKALGTVLSKYKDTYYTQVLLAYFATYILYPLCHD